MFLINPPAATLFGGVGNAIAEAFGTVDAEMSMNTALPRVKFNLRARGQDLITHPDFVNFLKTLEARPAIEATNVTVRCHAAQNRNFVLTYSVGDGIGAFSFSDVEGGAEVLPIVDALHKHLPLMTKPGALAKKLEVNDATAGSFQRVSLAQLEAEVIRIATIATDQISRQTSYVEDLDRQYREKVQTKEAELSAQAAQARTEFDAERRAFTEKIAQFETDEAKFVRRKLMVDARNASSQAKVVTSGWSSLRRLWIHVVFLAVLGAAGFGAYSYIRRVLADQAFDWHFAVAAAACSLTFVSFAIYYLRWNDQWASDHAQLEFSNHRFNLDLLRASWLAELLFDWDQEKKTAFPSELISAFGHNLFRPHGAKQAEHPIEQLAGMMGDVNKLKLGKSGMELERTAPVATGNGKAGGRGAE